MANIYDLSDTWNDGGTTFNAIKMNVTDTASASGSLLMDLQAGGNTKFSVRKDGAVTLNVDGLSVNENFVYTGSNAGTLTHRIYAARGTQDAPLVSVSGDKLIGYAAFPRLSTGFSGGPGARMQFVYRGDAATNTRATDIEFETSIGVAGIWPRLGILNTGGMWLQQDGFVNGTTSRAYLHSEGADILSQRNDTNAQTFNLYNTYTDASNYERGFMKWNSNVLEIGTEAAGAGTGRAVSLKTNSGRYLTLSNGTTLDTNPTYTRFFAGVTVVANINMNTKKIVVGSDGQFAISSGIDSFSTAADVGIARDSANVLKVTDGSTGTGELIASNVLIGTNSAPAVKSDTTQAGANSVAASNIVTISQANYDALTPDADTIYFIV